MIFKVTGSRKKDGRVISSFFLEAPNVEAVKKYIEEESSQMYIWDIYANGFGFVDVICKIEQVEEKGEIS